MKILFSYKGNVPENLPERIFLNDGSTRTCLDEMSHEELNEYGFIPVAIPDYDIHTEKIIWNRDKISYEVVSLSSEELFDLHKDKWQEIKNDIDSRINAVNKKIVEQYFQDGKIMFVLIKIKNILENITLYDGNPYDFILPPEVNIHLDGLTENNVMPELNYMNDEEMKEFRDSGEYDKLTPNPEDLQKLMDMANSIV